MKPVKTSGFLKPFIDGMTLDSWKRQDCKEEESRV
jgi:hypothetical protein